MTLLRNWAPYFQSSARTKGRAYQLSGRVKQVPPTEGELVRAEVRGGQVYIVTIAGEGSSATARCTCPRYASGTYCKHIWATLLDVARHGITSTAPVSADASAAPPTADSEIGGELRLPKARKRDPGQKQTRTGEPAWVGRLSLLRPPAMGFDPAAPAGLLFQQQVCYVIDPELSMRHNALVVELHQRQPTRTGWSKPKPLRVAYATLHELQDSADRELCSLLLGASGLEAENRLEPSMRERGQCIFRIHIGARRTLLRQMIATGRCFLSGESEAGDMGVPSLGQPLELWDDSEPWVLWSVGTMVGNDLSIGVELRRDDRRIGIEEPDLVLGGADGLLIEDSIAHPFDDREAPRWVQQFRDESRSLSSPWTITVPEADIPRFLERLYLLPQLPELDLPEGVSRNEVRVDPVPQLEIFSPVEPAPAPSSSSDPNRGLLNARVWFAYGDFPVKPGQPGRFVATTGPADAAISDTIATTAALNVSGSDSLDDDEDAEDDAVLAEAAALIGEEGGPTPENGDANASNAASATEASEPDPEAPAVETPSGLEGLDLSNSNGLLIRRNRRKEEDAIASLVSLGFRHYSAADTLQLPAKLLPIAVTTLLERGWSVMADQRLIRRAGIPRMSISSGVDWFELRGGVRFETSNGEQIVGLPEILAAARAGKTMISLGDGTQGMLPTQWLASHGLLLSIGQVQDDHLRFKNTQAALLDSLLTRQELVDVDEKFAEARLKLQRFEAVQPVDPAPTFQGSLRPYQREGLGWLTFQRWFGLGGILADDMGLGKTIQVLAMFDRRYSGPDRDEELTREHRPSLIVVPRSVVFNWMDEARRFTPNLRVQAYTGSERESLRQAFLEHDVIVTSYGLMRRDIAELCKFRFDCIVLDEAQAIKNASSQSAKAARLLQSNSRLALTGTPVENHLSDLWSIFEFLNPGLLGAGSRFADLIKETDGRANRGQRTTMSLKSPSIASPNGAHSATTPAASGGSLAQGDQDAHIAQQIGQALRPLILRRTKAQVLRDLPEKTEQTIVCQMEPEQRKVYDDLLKHYRGALLNHVDARGVGGSAIMVLEALLRLRQAACHPGLIDPARSNEPSAKLDALVDRLADLIEGKHKSLVFSQFTSMLALVRKRLEERGIVHEYLDGQTRHRRQHVQRFQTDPNCPVFLISLRAGGLGLNLTAAEYVFILDPWWNPAVEAQAIDRAHRIGQTRPVFAYRLICENTVEQRIAELQQKKKKLADAILGGQENLLRNLTREDLERLLS